MELFGRYGWPKNWYIASKASSFSKAHKYKNCWKLIYLSSLLFHDVAQIATKKRSKVEEALWHFKWTEMLLRVQKLFSHSEEYVGLWKLYTNVGKYCRRLDKGLQSFTLAFLVGNLVVITESHCRCTHWGNNVQYSYVL